MVGALVIAARLQFAVTTQTQAGLRVNQSANNSRSTPAESWFVATESGAVEYCLDALKLEIERGGLHPRSLVWRKGMQDWVQLDQVPLLRMLTTVQPSSAEGHASPFAALGAPVSSMLLDEQFEDQTTVFTPANGAPTQAHVRSHPSADEVSSDAPSESAGASGAPSTSVFDGLFDVAEPTANTVPESSATDAHNGAAQASPQVETSEQAVNPACGSANELPPATSGAGTHSAKPIGLRGSPRRNKPDSVPRRQKSVEVTRPVPARPATPRISMAGLSARSLESKPVFQLPKPEPIPVSCTQVLPPISTPITRTHAPPLVREARRQNVDKPLSTQDARPAASPALTAATEDAAPQSAPPIVLPLPMPALPPPPSLCVPTKETASDASAAHPPAGLARPSQIAPKPVSPFALVEPSGARDGSEPRADSKPADNEKRSLGVIVPSAVVAVGGPDLQHSPSGPDPVEVQRHTQRLPAMQAIEGDSLFPSASSIHPALFRPSRSRRTLFLLGSFGVAAMATFAIVLATNTSTDVSNPRPASARLQERAPVATPSNPTSEQQQPTASSATEPVQVTKTRVQTPSKPPDVRAAVATQPVEATAQSPDTKRSAVASGVRRNRNAQATGAVAIAGAVPPESGQPAVEKRDNWEQGTVEKRAWMEPGF